ncbi:hypothetical protein Tco_1251831 [Tanacetum coccineum]
MMKAGFLDFGGGGAKKKKNNDPNLSENDNRDTDLSTQAVIDLLKQAAEFPSLETSNGKPTDGHTLYSDKLVFTDANVMKEDVCNASAWVKLHDISITAFTEDELKDTLVVDIHKWKPPRCSKYNVYSHILNACLKKSVANVSKNFWKSRQAPRGNPEVSNSNPFDALNSVKNDVVFGMNGGILKSVDKGTINGSSSNTPIVEKIDKIERQIREGKLRFVDDEGNTLVPTGNVDSVSEVEAICDDLDITIRGRKKK